MKLFFTVTLFIITQLGCKPQQQQNMIETHFSDKKIISDMDTKFYVLRYNLSKIHIEIYVNDMLLLKNDTYSAASQQYYYLNHLLSSRREQKIKVKVLQKANILLDENSFFVLELSSFKTKTDWNNDDFSSQNKIIKYDSQDEINLTGKNSFEKEFTFTIDQELADTSPNLNTLAKNLSAIDTILLKKQLLKKYRQLVSSVKQQDRALFNEIYSGKIELFTQYNQLNKEEIEGVQEEADFIFKETELILNDDVEMFFYGNDRIISLENIKDRKPALSFKYKAEDDNYYSIEIPLYFYIPKDSTELKILY